MAGDDLRAKLLELNAQLAKWSLREDVDGVVAKAQAGDRLSLLRVAVSVSALHRLLRALGAHGLFVSLLQQCALEDRLRRKIEKASAYFDKTLRTPKADAALAVRDREAKAIREYLAAATEAVATCKEQSAVAVASGRFHLVNGGGFDASVMATVSDTLDRVTGILDDHGFGFLAYGRVTVVRSIKSRPKISAFYRVVDDEMFLRANRDFKPYAVADILHELGHRLEEKFLKDPAPIRALYRELKEQTEDLRREDARIIASNVVVPGREVQDGKRTFVTEGVDPLRDVVRLRLTLDGEPQKITATISLRGYALLVGVQVPDRTAFVSDYASTDPSENFAEMFSAYLLGSKAAAEKLGPIVEAVRRPPPRRDNPFVSTATGEWRGKSRGVPLSALDPAALAEGARHEEEHTGSKRLARRIAADHLVEDPAYYQKLARVERRENPSVPRLPRGVRTTVHYEAYPDRPAEDRQTIVFRWWTDQKGARGVATLPSGVATRLIEDTKRAGGEPYFHLVVWRTSHGEDREGWLQVNRDVAEPVLRSYGYAPRDLHEWRSGAKIAELWRRVDEQGAAGERA